MWNNSYQVDLAFRHNEYGASDLVKSAACRFYEVYGREQCSDEVAIEEVVLPLLTQEKTREHKRRKQPPRRGQSFVLTTFKNTIVNNMLENGPHIRFCWRRSILSMRS